MLGGGLAGAAAAYFLAERGVAVALVERGGEIAGGATARNAGLILTGLGDHYVRIARGAGRAEAAAIERFTIENGRLVREAVARERIACGYDPCGSYALATFPAEARDLVESHALMAEDGLAAGATLLSAEALAAEPRAPRGLGAIRYDGDAAVDAAALARGLAGAAEARGGATILRGAEVRAIETGGGGARLAIAEKSGAREIEAAVAVIATNAEAPRLHRFFEGLIWPVRGQGFITRPLPPTISRGVSASWGHEYYRQRADGRIVAAGVRPDPTADEIGLAEVVTDEFQGFLTTFLAERFPALAGAPIEVESRFASIAAFSRDGLPILGPVPGAPALVALCGFLARGLSVAVAAGKAIAELIVDGRREYPGSFAAGRFL